MRRIIEVVEYLGADSFVVIDCGTVGAMIVRTARDTTARPGEKLD